MVKKILFTLIAVGLLSAVSGLGGLAVFTDQDTVDANTFTTDSLDMSTNPTTALVTFSNMAPGDEVTAPLTVNNDSTALELRYAVSSTTTEDTLAAQLDLTIKENVTTCTNAEFDTDGTVVYGAADLGSMAGINVIGDPTQGADAGDRVLAASANEVLCFNVELPLTTDDTYEGLTTTATFTLDAEQTVNNP
jgi:predicted ribosomally synthesized peptide with SipW-like signal peptide